MLRALVLLLLVSACGGGGSSSPDADSGCDPTAALPAGWTPIDSVSAGDVDSNGGTLLIDASAGGFGGSDTEPFVYLSFSGSSATKVSITDADSYDDATWDLALKRYVIRANGGDSGPGGVRVASVDAASLADVTTLPSDDRFATDDWTDPTCTFIPDALGAPVTTFSLWYDVADGILTPRPLVFVLDLGDSHIKLEIIDYYANPNDPDQSGYFEIAWATL